MSYVPHTEIVNMTNIFTGADGGVGFLNFRSNYDEIIASAELGDEDSIKLLTILQQGMNAINVLSNMDVFTQED